MNNANDTEVTLKDRILTAAIEEFGQKGYDTASTNVIVQNAMVSKGLLFHYYGSKRNLYLEAICHVVERLAKYITEKFDFTENDIFAMLKQALTIKMNFLKDYPTHLGLLNRAWYLEYREDIEARIPNATRDYRIYGANPFYRHADIGKLKNGLDYHMVVEYTAMLMDACWRRFIAEHKEDSDQIALHIDDFLTEIDSVLDLIKHGAYRE